MIRTLIITGWDCRCLPQAEENWTQFLESGADEGFIISTERGEIGFSHAIRNNSGKIASQPSEMIPFEKLTSAQRQLAGSCIAEAIRTMCNPVRKTPYILNDDSCTITFWGVNDNNYIIGVYLEVSADHSVPLFAALEDLKASICGEQSDEQFDEPFIFTSRCAA
jgi:hypothetical protein